MIFRLGGVTFNDGGDLVVMDFTAGNPDVVDGDAPKPMGDGVFLGRDFLGSAVWAFDIETRGRVEAGAIAANKALAAVWRAPKARLTPNVAVPLSYKFGGRWRRVYGRPGKYAGINGDTMTRLGRGKITADFRVTDPLHYDDTETTVVLDIVPATTGGFIFPLVFPLTSVRSGEPRAGFVDNTGDADTPLKVTFHGPVVDPWVRAAAGWEIGLKGSLAYDVSVTVDPLAGTVTRSDGAAVAGMLTRKTRLSGSKLPPGRSELTFGGRDITGTATATLAWRNAHESI